MTLGAPRPLVSSRCASVTASAKAGGVRWPGGSLTQSRQVITAPATTCASSKAVMASALRAIGLSTTTSPAVESSVSPDLWRV